MARHHPALRAVFRILMAAAVLVAVFFIIRWGWRTWRAFGGFLISWWKENLADPILRLLIRALDVADGDVLLVLSMIAVANWLMARVLFGMVFSWSANQVGRQQRTTIESAISSGEEIHVQLRNMFADDVEKIAFYESRLGTSDRGDSATRSQLLGCGSCLFSVVWGLISLPVSTMIGVALFDGVLRLFGGYGERQVLMSAAGPLAGVLDAHLPLPTHCLGFALQERSLVLTLLCLAVGVLWWLLLNISVSGWTLPSIKPASGWLVLIPITVLLYIFLDGLLLLWTLIGGIVVILHVVLKNVWRTSYLRLGSIAYRLRKRAAKSRERA